MSKATKIIEDFLDSLPRKDCIIKIRCKYACETRWEILNELVCYYESYDGMRDVWEWQYDWFEGQDDVEILGYIPIDSVDVPILYKSSEWSTNNINHEVHINKETKNDL